ncbi:MAG: hypothetical protein SGPRY_012423 [Prymnesium sp.]
MFSQDGFINQRIAGKDNSAFHRKTTIGEGIAFLGYMYALASNPGTPVKEMCWAEKAKNGVNYILPSPALGRFGIAENHFERLQTLVASMHSDDESELDQEDHPFALLHHAHRRAQRALEQNLHGLLAARPGRVDPRGMDRTTCPYSRTCRVSQNLWEGAEIKDAADGESGALLFLELALKYKRQRNDRQVVPPFAEQPGKDTQEAQCLRLTKQWFNTGRTVGADFHFMSVAACEALQEEKGRYGFGDVKHATAGYLVMKPLEAALGPESGDWAVMNVAVIQFTPTSRPTARRSAENISSTQTIPSPVKAIAAQRANDRGSPTTGRKPHIDENNRWRQLAIRTGDRGKYHVNKSEYDTFMEFVNDVAYDAMTNTYDADHVSNSSHLPFATPILQGSSKFGSITSGSRAETTSEEHKSKQCAVCDRPTSYCCSACWSAESIVVVYPLETERKGVKKQYGCIARHARYPGKARRTVASASRSAAMKRRYKTY